MPDIFSKSKRSEVMSKIKSKGTKLDGTMQKILQKSKIKHEPYPKIYGNPDFLIGNRIALFCDSSFWHGRHWKKLKTKLVNGNNPNYWVNHIQKNRNRDKLVTKILQKEGYKVIRFWDDDVYKRPAWCVSEIKKYL